ncbi:MAG: hypothetical protein ABGX83_05490 [Nitrospira sp.]
MPTKIKPKSVKIRFEWFGEFIDQEWNPCPEEKCPHCKTFQAWVGPDDEWLHCLNCGSLFKYFFPDETQNSYIVGLLGTEMIDHMTFDEQHRLQALKRAVSNLG